MKPAEIVERIRKSGRQHYVYRVGRQIVVARKDTATHSRMEIAPNAELIGVYGKAARAEWIAEDLQA